MKEKFCEIGYVNSILNNVLQVDETELNKLYEDLRECSCLIPYGSGRSLYALNIGSSQLAKVPSLHKSKKVISLGDVGFPGGDMFQAASTLEKEYDKILLLIASGSGESLDPLIEAKNLVRYAREKKSEKFKIDLITSTPNSSMGKIAREYGNILKVKGRTKEEAREVKVEPTRYMETGIMGDKFEQAVGFLMSMMVEGLYKKFEVEKLIETMEEEARKIGETVDRNVDSETYSKSVDMLERRCDIFGCAKGVAENVANMLLIRLSHIKHLLGDDVYPARGLNTPRPRPGDFGISISYSGETEQVVEWSKKLKKSKCNVLSVVSKKECSLARISDYYIVLEEETKIGEPRRFYMESSFVLSPLPVKLCERLRERGLDLPENILRWLHSILE